MQVSRPVVVWLLLLPALMLSYYVAVVIPEISRIQSPDRLGDVLVEMGANMVIFVLLCYAIVF